MKFDELCKFVLIDEADRDMLSGKDKVFSLSDDALDRVKELDLSDVKELIRKTTLPFTSDYITRLIADDLVDYLPAETQDLKKLLKRNIWSAFDDSEKKSARAAEILFAFLKNKKFIVPGIPKSEDPDESDIENLAKELEADVDDTEDIKGLSMYDVDRLGGVTPRSTGHPEDESEFY